MGFPSQIGIKRRKKFFFHSGHSLNDKFDKTVKPNEFKTFQIIHNTQKNKTIGLGTRKVPYSRPPTPPNENVCSE